MPELKIESEDKFVIDIVTACLNVDMRLMRDVAKFILEPSRDYVNMHSLWKQAEMDYMLVTQGEMIEEIDYNQVVSQLADKRYRYEIDHQEDYDDEQMD